MSEGAVSIRRLNPTGLPQPHNYAQVVEIRGGRTVYVSGQVPLDENGELIGTDDFASQARQTFENVRRALAAVGLTFDDVVKLQIYVIDMADLPTLRAVRGEFIHASQQPAMTAVAVSALFRPDVLLEVDAIAVG